MFFTSLLNTHSLGSTANTDEQESLGTTSRMMAMEKEEGELTAQLEQHKNLPPIHNQPLVATEKSRSQATYLPAVEQVSSTTTEEHHFHHDILSKENQSPVTAHEYVCQYKVPLLVIYQPFAAVEEHSCQRELLPPVECTSSIVPIEQLPQHEFHLPPEIWSMIIARGFAGRGTAGLFEWTQTRCTSRLFRQEVERQCFKYQTENTMIKLDLDEGAITDPRLKDFLGGNPKLDFCFDGLDGEKNGDARWKRVWDAQDDVPTETWVVYELKLADVKITDFVSIGLKVSTNPRASGASITFIVTASSSKCW